MFIRYALFLALGLVGSFAKAEFSNSSHRIKEGLYEFPGACNARISMADNDAVILELVGGGMYDHRCRTSFILTAVSNPSGPFPQWEEKERKATLSRLNETQLSLNIFDQPAGSYLEYRYILTFFSKFKELPQCKK